VSTKSALIMVFKSFGYRFARALNQMRKDRTNSTRGFAEQTS
jgi:hypothetical protein